MPLNEASRWEPSPGNLSPQEKTKAMITTAPRTRAATKTALVPLDQIDFPANARPTHADKVSELVASIRLLGLQSAPTVIDRNGRYVLVTGRHRLEAMRVIGKDPVPVRIVDFDEIEARLWTISENLHRNELSALDRAEQVAEFVRLSEEVRKAAPVDVGLPAAHQPQAAQVAHPAKRYEQRGDSLAARDHGLSRDEVRRARTIAALPSVVKDRARSLGVDGNQSALLDAAKAQTMVAQISALEQRAVRPAAPIAPRPSPLRNLENIAAGTLARWVKETTPNDRAHVIDVLERTAAILRDELNAERAA
jgi:ParB family transcriptional regulator, chromosome partitioning protein